MEHVLVLLRHGHSEWNLTDRFTGWTDIALTEVGLAEGAAAGQALAQAGYGFDEVHVSVLQRTQQTAQVVLAAMHTPDVAVYASWRLNERHYGALQGLNKQEIFSTWGEQASRRWWRGYDMPPPAVDDDDPRHPRFDSHYAAVPAAELPATESLADCQRRTLPYWHDVLAPRLRTGRRLLVVSHGNTLRGLVMHIEQLAAARIEHVEIAPGVPLVYRFSPELELLNKQWLNITIAE